MAKASLAPSIAKTGAKASEKNRIVSITEPITDETKGARHQRPSRRRLNTATSRSWATRNAVPEAMAMRGVAKTTEADQHDQTRRRGAETAIGQISHQERYRIGERTPGQKIGEVVAADRCLDGKLDEIVGRGDHRAHRRREDGHRQKRN